MRFFHVFIREKTTFFKWFYIVVSTQKSCLISLMIFFHFFNRVLSQNRLILKYECTTQGCRPWGCLAPPVFGRSVNPISTGGRQIMPNNYFYTPGFSDLSTALPHKGLLMQEWVFRLGSQLKLLRT